MYTGIEGLMTSHAIYSSRGVKGYYPLALWERFASQTEEKPIM